MIAQGYEHLIHREGPEDQDSGQDENSNSNNEEGQLKMQKAPLEYKSHNHAFKRSSLAHARSVRTSKLILNELCKLKNVKLNACFCVVLNHGQETLSVFYVGH